MATAQDNDKGDEYDGGMLSEPIQQLLKEDFKDSAARECERVRKQLCDLRVVHAEKKKKAEAILQQRRSKQQLRLDLTSKAVATMVDQGKASSEEAERMQYILQDSVRDDLEGDICQNEEDPQILPSNSSQIRSKRKTTKQPVSTGLNLPNHQPQHQQPLLFPVKTAVSNLQRDKDI